MLLKSANYHTFMTGKIQLPNILNYYNRPMKKLVLTFALAFTVMGTALAQDTTDQVQENMGTHSVAMGETVLVIAKKYKITPADIYDYNPDAIQGLSANTVLRIPLHRQLKPKAEVAAVSKTYADEMYGYKTPEPKKAETATSSVVVLGESQVAKKEIPVAVVPHTMQTLQHTVKSGETLYSLSRKYNTTVQNIEKENRDKLKAGLETGTVLNITTIPRAGDPDKYITHSVAAGETLFSLAKRYNTTVEAITESNRTLLKKGLMSGQQLAILPGGTEATAPTPANSFDINKTEIASGATIEHTVQNGDTLMGLAKKYHTTVDEITAANGSKLNSGLQTGLKITIRNSAAISTVTE